MKIVVKDFGKELAGNEGEQVFVYEPIKTLNRFLQLYQYLLTSFSANLESQYDVTLNEFQVLMMTGQLGETASHEIADLTGMPIMAISRTVAALDKRGMIERKIDSNNRRRKPINLTGKGQRLFDEMMPTSNLVAKYLFDSLRLDEALSFDHCLQVLLDHITLRDEKGKLVFVKQTREQPLRENLKIELDS